MFGVEVETVNGDEPSVSARIEGGVTVREALMQIMAGLPGYSFDAVSSHLINVFPTKALSDSADLLNLRVADLHFVSIAPTNFLGNPAWFIPELKMPLTGGRGCAIGPGLGDKSPGITADLDGRTVWEDLNLVSEISVRSAEKGQGSAYGWLYSHEKLPSATHPEHMWRVLSFWAPAKSKKAP